MSNTGSHSDDDNKFKVCAISEIKAELGTSTSLLDEKYPHVAKYITKFWGRAEFYECTNELLVYSPTVARPSREGFPDDVIKEIFLIIKIHDRLFPYLIP